MLQRPSSIFLFLTALCLVIFELESLLAQEDDKEFFEKKVRPIFAERCWSCHSGQAGESKGSLRLDHIELIQKGGDSGPALVARDVDASLIYQAVS
ncbi:MAG: c-type cytochrome domain-containing protein, partial [Pirellula sp.]